MIHTRIGKEQGRVIDGHARTRRPKNVLMLFDEKVDKRRADFVHWPHGVLFMFFRHDVGVVLRKMIVLMKLLWFVVDEKQQQQG